MNGAAGAVGSDGCCRELPGGWKFAMPLEAETRHWASSQGCMRAQPILSGPVQIGPPWVTVGDRGQVTGAPSSPMNSLSS